MGKDFYKLDDETDLRVRYLLTEEGEKIDLRKESFVFYMVRPKTKEGLDKVFSSLGIMEKAHLNVLAMQLLAQASILRYMDLDGLTFEEAVKKYGNKIRDYKEKGII